MNDVLLFSTSSNTVNKFDVNTYTDLGDPIECEVSGVVQTNLPLQLYNLMITTSQSSSTTYNLSWRNSYDTDYNTPRVLTMNRGDMTNATICMVGQAVPPYKEFSITHTDNVDIDIIDLSYGQPNRWMQR